MDKFYPLNGGKTGKYYGRIQENGDLIFYEAKPELVYGSFTLLEAIMRNKERSLWKKRHWKGLESYQPDW